ncbi:zinc-binding dehydrogenase [Rhizobiaceae bacterium n13]|uniref:Zinc-binding dehydrogenase n=1 Tax=Ferirhizobium litorale TaxID=2927786 RepID=A0AAE3QH30_9HYPH|nr:zinc-binding dehydrogenase [Fererhizobium litorale]MDI7864982.1 zinc-binding dehydrogenase [Fererhizobium litorale]MDI7925075.1 zinc-binding dehydrogenase [Fererhizobium litorale]
MKAIVYDLFGEADVLRLADVTKPEMRPGDLLVKVMAAGVNRADLLQRQGYYGKRAACWGWNWRAKWLHLAAMRPASVKETESWLIVGGGAYAEYARVDHRMAVRIPEDLGYVEAAAIMESFVTAWEAVAHLGQTHRGDAVLIHAAAGGVGSSAVQIARALGANVFATAAAARRSEVGALGAQAVFDYRSQDFERGFRDATDGRGDRWRRLSPPQSAQPCARRTSRASWFAERPR